LPHLVSAPTLSSVFIDNNDASTMYATKAAAEKAAIDGVGEEDFDTQKCLAYQENILSVGIWHLQYSLIHGKGGTDQLRRAARPKVREITSRAILM
jgi:hypothetical protein